MPPVDDSRTRQLRRDLTRASAAFAVELRDSYRANLGVVMRQALSGGLPREQVIALSVLPREEAEALLPA